MVWVSGCYKCNSSKTNWDVSELFSISFLSGVYSNKRGWWADTTFNLCQNAACSHEFFPLRGRFCINVILASCFTLRGHGTHTSIYRGGRQDLLSFEA